ncbi:dnaJ homolog subfamily C member 12-like [Littorina saxatilis]|uniref:J domain-containing protein n=1 Tax=Littorina saxatilis TaxID=31220 RepID=A0AAN9BY39_9CAEN
MDQILSYERNEADDYYNILGCSEHSTEEQITTEYRARVLHCHPDKHPDDPTAAEQFGRLSKAKETLTNPDTRAKYDKWRRSGIAMSYDAWCGMRDSVHTSMHWATKAPQPQIVAPSDQAASSSSKTGERDQSANSSGHTSRERSPSPRQALPYDKAQQVDLTFPSRDKQSGTSERVDWRPREATGLLQKFRNYEI